MFKADLESKQQSVSKTVRITNCYKTPLLNNACGTVLSYDAKRDIYVVKLFTDHGLLKTVNIPTIECVLVDADRDCGMAKKLEEVAAPAPSSDSQS